VSVSALPMRGSSLMKVVSGMGVGVLSGVQGSGHVRRR
jgi:hypothetical protein